MAEHRLALLGGSGLRSEAREVWQRLRVLFYPVGGRAAIVLFEQPGRKAGVAEERGRLFQETLASSGIEAEVFLQADPALLRGAACIILASDEPRVLVESLLGSAAWVVIRERYEAGVPLVGVGGAAVVLGERVFAPLRPYPSRPDALTFESLPGLGLLPGVVILPYYDWLSQPVIEQIAALNPPKTILVGLDEHAALVVQGGAWQVIGLGGVTIWRDRRVIYIAEAGEQLPQGIL